MYSVVSWKAKERLMQYSSFVTCVKGALKCKRIYTCVSSIIQKHSIKCSTNNCLPCSTTWKLTGKTLRWIRNLYWEQTAAVRVDSELSEWTKIERGVRQGCVLSPDLFSLYSEIILREVEDLHGVLVNGVNINNIRYADDTVLISETETGLCRLSLMELWWRASEGVCH